MQDDDLDRLLAAAARNAQMPSENLMQRVLLDALALQAAPPMPASVALPPRAGLVRRMLGAVGGVSALVGLGTAAALGLALGYLSPTTTTYLTGGSSGTADFFPDPDFLTTEG